jgi:hypothetical protein
VFYFNMISYIVGLAGRSLNALQGVRDWQGSLEYDWKISGLAWSKSLNFFAIPYITHAQGTLMCGLPVSLLGTGYCDPQSTNALGVHG